MSDKSTRARRAALVAVTATAALVLTACGGDGGHSGHSAASPSTSADPSAGPHNAQDVSFAQGMIPHHRQAVEMAALASHRAASAEVKDLAARIEKAQDPEIATMTGWLRSWGAKVPAADSAASMPGMDHSGHSGMSGMMSTKDMDALKAASGEEFDTMFLTMMVEHHKGAVEMAGTEKAKGRSGSATSMADDIITAQNAEITEMNKLLGQG
ncbi:DUF305 domain-containing protein [Streptomyces sp. Tue6028]|uniref:DUF305 domain-containing protein n=1 Tax=Streptomyces sp. Tue6028 TaxID=2036037 RepID=UPI000BB327FA|nr:DUF305 domain-containing protein [Streptomyces sp. Tue6028]PBC60971.1 DUF305 domain-containing protein [Streptomyces sp. Tue6028]